LVWSHTLCAGRPFSSSIGRRHFKPNVMHPLMLVGIIDGAIKYHLPPGGLFVHFALKHEPTVVYEINFLVFIV
ncbi:MAG: hypothetical protein PVH35_01105, partial [Syntrophobacterales bacterium]